MQLRANLNFDGYRRGNVYLLPDARLNEDQALSLLGAGYFTEVCDDRVDNADPDTDPADDVVGSAPFRDEVTDGQVPVESRGEAAADNGADDSSGSQDD